MLPITTDMMSAEELSADFSTAVKVEKRQQEHFAAS